MTDENPDTDDRLTRKDAIRAFSRGLLGIPIKQQPGEAIGSEAVETRTFYIDTDMAEEIHITHNDTTYEVVERGNGIALEPVPEERE